MSQMAIQLETAALERTADKIAEEHAKIERSDLAVQRVRSGFDPRDDISFNFIQVWPSHPKVCLTSSQWSEFLPPYSRAVEFLEFYGTHVVWTYHFVHMPTLRRHLDETYQKLACGSSVEPSVVALLCAIFALATYFLRSTPYSRSSNYREYREFVSLTSQALAEARHIDSPTIESIQAVLLLAGSLFLNLGAIPGFRVLLTTMFLCAHTLQFHQVDSPKNQRLRQNTPYDRIELEMKRRIWWLIASSDWLSAFIAGYPIGTYVVHPHQMHVNLPSNADDDAITRDHCPNEPLTTPTDMTYFIFRCQLSTIFREFIDHANTSGVEIDEMDYEHILTFERRINEFTDTVPYFLRSDAESRRRCKELDKQRPYLFWQRYMAQFGAGARMSRLHRQYLARGARDPRYAYSRMVCLSSSRAVLEAEKQMRADVTDDMPNPSRIWLVMYQVFLATVVLVMDFIFNKDEPYAEARIAEITECCRRLEEAKDVSPLAERGLEELKGVMRKWGLLNDMGTRTNHSERREVEQPTDTSVPELLPTQHQDAPMSETAGGSELPSSWIDAWDFNVELDFPQWEAIFRDLERKSGVLC
ncbi:hypothetical protein AJ80_03432 [Polytolypa hystricis UAMH7299]|uniref:Xylanolytic transcriptional activator regulatory domain-containing protein n=1 Tax=Polytolypa hystricis (strain UAMH7299) TaxID=1447883 RepID=A0A2B7YHN9_POLH7|nr:hypothetical protein AJ80_03432 [Polytolypa hystricis UAMH7299]